MEHQRIGAAAELTHIETSMCHALICLSVNINVFLQKLVDKGIFSEDDKKAFDSGMMSCVAEMALAELNPNWSHRAPQDEIDLEPYSRIDQSFVFESNQGSASSSE